MRLKLVPTKIKIDFFKLSSITFGASLIGMLIAIFLFLTIGLNFGIDFRGGTTIRTDSEVMVDVAKYRSVLSRLDLGDISITEVFDPTKPGQNVAQIRIEQQEDEGSATVKTVEMVQKALRTIDSKMTFPSVESVGPKVSGELIKTAVIAVVSAIFAVLFYIWLRFEWQFSVGAVAALIHDIVLTIGIFSVLQIKFDLAIIAALLTIVGYSLNDTVVVFDRVRENLRKYSDIKIYELTNISINETLSRTIITSATTLLALLAIYFFGGEILKGFSLAMILGVVFGTYSSIYISNTVLVRLRVSQKTVLREEEDKK